VWNRSHVDRLWTTWKTTFSIPQRGMQTWSSSKCGCLRTLRVSLCGNKAFCCVTLQPQLVPRDKQWTKWQCFPNGRLLRPSCWCSYLLAIRKVGARFLCYANKRNLLEVTQRVEVMALEVILRRQRKGGLRNDTFRDGGKRLKLNWRPLVFQQYKYRNCNLMDSTFR
jgi:hypothetical protein